MNKKRLEYKTLVISPVVVEISGKILASSYSPTKIDAGTIDVEDFKSGFGTPDGIEAGRDYKDISFD